jgi:hypothetical protein
MNLKSRLMSIKKRKESKKEAVIYIRVSSEVRDMLVEKLDEDELTYKDLLVAAISDYLGKDVSDIA